MEKNSKDSQTAASRSGEAVVIDAPALAGLAGRMRVDVKDEPTATIHLDNGRLWASPPEDESEATAVVQDRQDFERMLAGELNPFVAAIQGRLWLHGDHELATRVILALNAAKPFAEL